MAGQQRDYYEVLGVERDADAKSIKDRFRELAMKYHPDRNKSPDAEAHFKEIAEAYAILSDPKKRADYDARGFAGVEGFSAEDLFSNIDFGDIFGDMGFGFDFGGGGLFGDFFGRHRKPRGPAKGSDLEVRLTIPLEKVNAGGEETVHFNRPVSCPDCHGSGAAKGSEPRACSDCGGSGKQVTTRQESKDRGSISFQQITVCPACHGQGTFIDKPCKTCDGRGEITQDDNLKVTIPAGVDEGTALRIPGHGLPSPASGGPPGDLFVVVHSQRDARFERHGADLWRREIIEVADAVLGTRIDIPTLDGEVEVKVPAGSQPDEVLRLKGKGLPVFGAPMRGDMNIRLQVHIPENPSKEEKELYRKLRESSSKSGKRWWQ
ncbi:MAG: molecular chaperone DnaJ [Gammaproteobacteria bacterium]|nr:MAG: molecular chaperone DnaJ [Gammaproteobacteria bacterium]UCH42066.1 MAG: molecular chaperone DnaJ [Gammaproteobacteria bacterium]